MMLIIIIQFINITIQEYFIARLIVVILIRVIYIKRVTLLLLRQLQNLTQY